MIIDFHTHVFPEKMAGAAITELEQKSGLHAATNGCVDGLLASMSNAGVDCSVILPVVTATKQFNGINRFAKAINDNPERGGTCREVSNAQFPKLISFGGIHPACEDYKLQLKELKDMGFLGIKLHPDYQGVFFDDIRYKRIVAYASELDMTIVVHAGIDIGIPEPVRCSPARSANVLKETQCEKLVLAHLGGWKQWDEAEALLVGTKAYLDTAFIQSFIGQEQFERIVKNHGSEKILFATDSPWEDQKLAVEWLQNTNLSEEVKEQVFYKNALRLLGKI